MTDHSRAQIDALFARALDRPVADRSRFLAAACTGDGVLQAEVEELLRLAEEPDAALDSIAGGQGVLLQALLDEFEERSEVERVGERIGRWRLIREFGRRVMGTVYLAERAEGEFEQSAAR